MTKEIKIIMLMKDISVNELARRLNTSPSNMTNKFKRDNFSEKELSEIAEVLECDLEIVFTDKASGKRFV